MGLFNSLKSIAKNLSSAIGTTAATIGRQAISNIMTEYTARRVAPAKPAVTASKAKAQKPPTPPLQAPPVPDRIDFSTLKGVSYSAGDRTAVNTDTEVAKLKTENQQLRDWIIKKKAAEQAEKDRIYRNKYEQYGFDDESRLNLNSAGLTVDAGTGKIVSSNGKLIMENLGYTPDEISRFFREHPEAADIDDSAALRQLLDAFFHGEAWDGADYVNSSGSF